MLDSIRPLFLSRLRVSFNTYLFLRLRAALSYHGSLAETQSLGMDEKRKHDCAKIDNVDNNSLFIVGLGITLFVAVILLAPKVVK